MMDVGFLVRECVGAVTVYNSWAMTNDIHREYGKGKSEMVKKKNTLKMDREMKRLSAKWYKIIRSTRGLMDAVQASLVHKDDSE